MPTQCWLVKQEPEAYPFTDLVKDRATAWTGVRNFQARNHLRAMKKGDSVLDYHSGEEKQVAGVARVKREAYADPTAKEGDWTAVDIEPLKPLSKPVPLAMLKADPAFRAMAMLKLTRLSVSPVTPIEFDRILKLGETRL